MKEKLSLTAEQNVWGVILHYAPIQVPDPKTQSCFTIHAVEFVNHTCLV